MYPNIEFTESCIVWNVDPIILTFGHLVIRWYSVIFCFVLLLGYAFLYHQFNKAHLLRTTNDWLKFGILIFLLIAGIIFGSYFGHRIFYKMDTIIKNPFLLFNFNKGFRGLSSHGAAIGVLVAVVVFRLISDIRTLEILDRFSFSAAIGATLVRVGNLMNSEIVGRKTDVAWAFCFPRYDGKLIPRHPSQIYEILIGLFVLFTLFAEDRFYNDENRPLGLMTGIFFGLYFSLRFFIEFFKEHHVLQYNFPLTIGQILSIPFFLVGFFLIRWSLKEKLSTSLKR